MPDLNVETSDGTPPFAPGRQTSAAGDFSNRRQRRTRQPEYHQRIRGFSFISACQPRPIKLDPRTWSV